MQVELIDMLRSELRDRPVAIVADTIQINSPDFLRHISRLLSLSPSLNRLVLLEDEDEQTLEILLYFPPTNEYEVMDTCQIIELDGISSFADLILS